MITKGEIQSIDYTGNTCIVRLPYFESAGITDKIFAEATISNQPGMYNGYKAGDVVFVAFDDGEADQPVVLGKLYLGATKEQKDPRGVMNAESSIISGNMSLPLSTKLVYDIDGSVAQNGQTRYDSIADITNKLANLTKQQSKGFVSKVETKYHLGSSNTVAPSDLWDEWSDNFTELTPTETLKYTWQWTKTWTKTIDYETDTFLDECEDKKTCVTGVGGEKGDKGDKGVGVYSEKTFYLAWDKSKEDDPEKIKVADVTDDNYDNGKITSGNNVWASPELSSVGDDQNVYSCLVTQLQDADGKFSYTVGNVSKNSAYALAQGKSTNYYSDNDPKTEGYHIKNGDCWFNSGYRLITEDATEEAKSFDSFEAACEWNSNSEKYIYTGEPEDDPKDISKYLKLTKELFESYKAKSGIYETGTLYEYDDERWQDISDDIVANKVTTNYLNAKEITAKKIVVLDDNDQELLTVNGDRAEATDSLISLGTDGLNIGYNAGSADSGTHIKNNQLSVLTDGSVWGKRLYVEQTDKHDENQTASSYFDGNVCGHQMKVDTVELATTNTGDGTDQTKGFRHEYYEVTANHDETNDTVSLAFGLKDLADTRTNDTETCSEEAVWAVLSNKTIGAALQLIIYTDENKSKTKSVTLSTTGTLRGYPYSMSDSNERTKTEVQGKFTSESRQSVSLAEISVSDTHHLQQKKWTVNKDVKDADAVGTIKDYTEGAETEIAELSNIACYGISSVKIIEISPKEEDYFTGDFYATSGFFKNKYTNFTTGMITDVFSLPWKRIYTDSSGNSTELPVPMQILAINTAAIGINYKYYLYKELRQGDFCTICTGDTTDILGHSSPTAAVTGSRSVDLYHLTSTYEEIFTKVYDWVDSNYYAFTERENDPTASSGEEVLPGLQNFTNISNVNLSLIRKNIDITLKSSMSLGNDWGKQTVKSFPTVYGTSIKTASDCENAPNYNIKVSSYGTNCYIEETRMSVGSIKTTYGIKGVTISMYIDKVDSHFTDNGIESDKIYVFCSRNGRLYTKESSTDDWTEKATISAMIGDTASLSIYGNNNKTTIDTDGYIAQSISTRYSGSYLAASKYDIAPLESNSTVSAWNTQLTAANSTLYSRDGIIVNNSTSISQIVDKSKLSPITPTNSSLNRFNTSN